jgi:DNA-binding PucR family transcriptional regulator/GAF domain-containing protein
LRPFEDRSGSPGKDVVPWPYPWPMRTSPAIGSGEVEVPIGTGDWLRAVLELARAAGSDASLESLFELVAQTAAGLTGAAAAAVQVVNDDGSALHIKGQVGLSDQYLSHVLEGSLISLDAASPYFHSPSSQAYRSGHVIVVDEVNLDDDYSPWVSVASSALGDGGAYRSLAAVPMVTEGERTGVLAVYWKQPSVATQDLLALLQLLAEHAALAMTLARVRVREREGVRMLVDANKTLQLQQAVLDQADDLQRGLMRAMLRSGDLGSIASTTANVMGLHIALEDNRGTILATASPDGSAAPTDEWLKSEAVSALPRSEDAGHEVAFVRRGSDDGTSDGWIIPLVLGEEVVAWLGAFGPAASDDDLQRRLIERTAMAMTVELWRQQSEREVEWRLSGDLLEHVLSDGATAPEDVVARATHLGYELKGQHWVLVFQVAVDDGDVDGQEKVRRAVLSGLERILRDSGVRAVLAWRDGVAVVLLSSKYAATAADVQQFARRLGRELAGHVPQREIVAVTSNLCEQLSDIADAHRTAIGAVALVGAREDERSSRNVRVLSTSDLGVYSVLLSAGPTPELRRLRDSTLGTLEDYDARKGGNLVQTLKVYLATGCKAQATAVELFMHPNTVMYRLKTVEKLTGLDLHRPDHIIQAQLAVMIDDVVGD